MFGTKTSKVRPIHPDEKRDFCSSAVGPSKRHAVGGLQSALYKGSLRAQVSSVSALETIGLAMLEISCVGASQQTPQADCGAS
jgi:hypothetical protein